MKNQGKVRYRTFQLRCAYRAREILDSTKPWLKLERFDIESYSDCSSKRLRYKARSLLYRRQILQRNIRWKALDEIYKIYMRLHRSDLNISEKFRQTFSHFSANFAKNWFTHYWKVFIEFCSEFDEILSEIQFRKISENSWNVSQILANSTNSFFLMWFWSCAK